MKIPAPEHVDNGHPGVWPNGESQSVRDEYDRILAAQAATKKASR